MNTIRFLMMSLSLCFALAPMAAQAGSGNNPRVTIGAGMQSGSANDMRGIIRVSYAGKFVQYKGCSMGEGPGWDGTGDTIYFAVSAQLGLSKGNTLSSMDVTILPISGHEVHTASEADLEPGSEDRVLDYAAFPVMATREVALGKEGKVRIDLMSVSSTWRERSAGDTNEFFVNVSANILGAQYLRATSYSQNAQNFYGLDVGDFGGEAGMTQYWSKGFRTRITLGAKMGMAAGYASEQGATITTEAREYLRFSAILDGKLGQLEAYLEGSANQMSLGSEAQSLMQLEFGALARF